MAKEAKSRVRIPVGAARDILTVQGQDPNYVYRWVLDDPKRPGRLQRFLDGGYEVVTDTNEIGQNTVDRGKKLGSAITRPDGSSTLVLMRILKEWYDQDQAEKADRITDLEETMVSDVKADGGYGEMRIGRRK